MSGLEFGAMVVTIIFGSLVTLTWVIMHYRSLKHVKPADLAAIESRLARIEQAVDAIAVEAERISEGQRFTTKVLSERTSTRGA